MTTAAPRRLQATPEGLEQGYGTDDMFFLLRVAFWLTIVLALLPSGGAQQSAQAKVGAHRCGGGRGRRGFRHEQLLRSPAGRLRRRRAGRGRDRPARPGRRQDGLRVHQRSCLARQRDRLGEQIEAGGQSSPAVRTVPASPGSQSTLKDSDLDPAWQGPPARDGKRSAAAQGAAPQGLIRRLATFFFDLRGVRPI